MRAGDAAAGVASAASDALLGAAGDVFIGSATTLAVAGGLKGALASGGALAVAGELFLVAFAAAAALRYACHKCKRALQTALSFSTEIGTPQGQA